MKPVKIKLKRDLSKHLKQGNPWVFKDALQTPLPQGEMAHIYSHKDEFLGIGLYHPDINLVFRLLNLTKTFTLDEVKKRFVTAVKIRIHLLNQNNNCFRLINGEGDELPGLVIDYYNKVAVIKCDGETPEKFWMSFNLVEILKTMPFPIEGIYLKRQNRQKNKGEILWENSKLNLENHLIIENGMKFYLNIIEGAKTGFFLDQRDSRNLIRSFSKGKRVLNLFSYTGGFSIAAGMGKATQVVSVDIAKEAIKAAGLLWDWNELTQKNHECIAEDAFDWTKKSIEAKKEFDLIITDPPSFAPNEKAVESAVNAYVDIFSLSLKLLAPNGIMAFSSCSGHIDFNLMDEIVQSSLSKTKKRGRVIKILGQPEDHPFPLALKEMRYLKFYLVQTF